MKYEIYHDENKNDGYHHGLFFVPVNKKDLLIEYLKNVRDEHGYKYDFDLKFAGVHKAKKKQQIINNKLALFSHAIKTRHVEPTNIINRTGKDLHERTIDPYLILNDNLGCRFGFLKIADNHENMNYLNSYSKKVETTFRFILKSCCHSMFNSTHPIEISNIYFDGNEHHAGGIDTERIIRGDFRDYVSFSDKFDVCSKQMSQREINSKLIMSFVDNIVGAWTESLKNGTSSNYLYPLSEIYKRAKSNKIFLNSNSRWNRSISFSEFRLENGEIQFPNLFKNKKQESLF